jgi:site-specific recombinase XerD
VRAIRAWLRAREPRHDARSPDLFLSERGPMTRQAVNYLVEQIGARAKLRFHVHPHMLRHSTGDHLVNRGDDTSLVQDSLWHRNMVHTVRNT